MSGYSETITLPPPQVYGRSGGTHEDHAVFEPRSRENAGKIMLCVVASLAVLLLILLIVRPFLIHKPPNASSISVAIRSLRFNNSSSSPYFNMTIAMVISYENPNAGSFEFPLGTGNILYNGHVVGQMRIDGQRVGSSDDAKMEVLAKVAYQSIMNSEMLRDDIQCI